MDLPPSPTQSTLLATLSPAKLRRNAWLAIGLSLSGLLTTLGIVSVWITQRDYSKLEQRETQQNVQRVLEAYERNLRDLSIFNFNWAGWDDTYSFIQGNNPTYIATNFTEDSFIASRANLVAFVNLNGQIVYGESYDVAGNQVPLPANLPQYLNSHPSLLQHNPADLEQCQTGLAMLMEVPVALTACPIVTSQIKGPIRGTLLMGQYLNASNIEQLGEITRLNIRLHRLDNSDKLAQPIADLAQQLRQMTSPTEPQPIVVQPLDGQTVAGYALLSGWGSKPGIVLEVMMPREVYYRGQVSLRYLMLSMAVVGLVFGSTTLFLAEKLMQYWRRQQETQAALRQSEATSRALLETVPDLMLRLDQTGICLDYIPAKGFKTALGDRQVQGLHLSDILPEPIAQRLLKYATLAMQSQATHTYEFQMPLEDDERYYESRIAMSSPREVLIMIRDITDRKRSEILQVANQHRQAWLAAHDPLTGLLNQSEFERSVQRAIMDAKEHHHQHMLCYFDIDNFKWLNDVHGRVAGDTVLRQVANILQMHIGFADLVARLQNDEFAILLSNCSPERAIAITNSIRQYIQNTFFSHQQKTISATVTVGLSMINANMQTAADAISLANLARS